MKSFDNQLKVMRDESALTPEAEALADAILKAAGSGLRHYSMAKIRVDILAAAQKGIDDARAEVLEALKTLLNAGSTGELALKARTQAEAIIAKARGETQFTTAM